MDLRHQIASETAALADRLTAIAQAELQEAEQNASQHVERLQQELATVREALQGETARAQELEVRLDAEADHTAHLAAQLEAEGARAEQEIAAAHAITDATSAEMSALARRFARLVAMLNGAAASLVTLSMARTPADLFAALVGELATEFERAAVFRVQGNHLEGEHTAGLDDSVDIHKIVVPMGLGSLITKAVTSGTIEHAMSNEIGDARPPFGGSPAAALAAPLVFDGEVLGILYLEADIKFTDAHGPLATILVRHANAVLAGLAQELRTSRQLREYARTLLHEAQTMFDADLQSNVKEPGRLERLRASVGFARDLYAQRAGLEAPLKMNLLDDEIGRMLREPSTPFITALASLLGQQDAAKDALVRLKDAPAAAGYALAD